MSSPDADDGSSIASQEAEDLEQDENDEMGQGSNFAAGGRTSATDGVNKKASSKSNAKDPSRPKRKKARRACFACQRAHLTCGDERPCLRCIKRGLKDHCHDGVRKKAKYLHDAPPEALAPGFIGTSSATATRPLNPAAGASVMAANPMPAPAPGTYFSQPAASGYPQYGSMSDQGQLGPNIMNNNGSLVHEFAGQANVESPTQFRTTSSQQVSPIAGLSGNVNQAGLLSGQTMYDPMFDPTDTSLFNLSELNFDNHYGALELSMLGHLSSGADVPSDLDLLNTLQPNSGSMSYDGIPPNYGYNSTLPAWQTIPDTSSTPGSTQHPWNFPKNGMDAFAVGEHSSSYSPLSQNQESSTSYTQTTMSPESQYAQPDRGSHSQDLLRHSMSHTQESKSKKTPFPSHYSVAGGKRRRDTSKIYSSVIAPYPYTQGFHALTALIKKRFPSHQVQSIAKSLSAFRPSFIACNKDLNHDDLIFMEKVFQRTMIEYEDFLEHYGTPTIIIRRTGEIAAVSKEFSLVTGWRRDVLLGKEPNLNVNVHVTNTSGTQTGTSSRGAVTPRIPTMEMDTSRPQAVFIAELLDRDSVVQFFDDFSELAFGASRGSIIGRACSLLKYKTKDDPEWRSREHGSRVDDTTAAMRNDGSGSNSGAASVSALEKNGRVNCHLCWTVKRDTFDIPMLIIMNFLPDI